MPLFLSIDRARRRIHVIATGVVQRADVSQSLADRVAAGAVAYDQIWDVANAIWGVRFDELKGIARDYRAALAGAQPGLLVMVATNDVDFGTLRQQEAYLRYYGREMMVCRSLEEAEAWLDQHRPPHERDGTRP